MRFSLDFRVESLLFFAFMATVPVYSPNMVMFTKGLPYSETFMPYFIYALMAFAVIGGIALGLYSMRHSCLRVLSTPLIFAAAISYLTGYILFMLIGGIQGLGSIPLTIFVALLLAFATVELGVAWGVYLATYYDLKQALIWIGIMVGASSVLQLLLSSVTFQVGAVVFFVLLIAGVALPCYLAKKGSLIPADLALDGHLLLNSAPAGLSAQSQAPGDEGASAPHSNSSLLGAYFTSLRSMSKVLIVPFIGLLVFAYVMGVRKYVLFDLIYVEILGGIGGAFLAVCICFVKRARPLLPFIYQVALPLFALLIIVVSCFPPNAVVVWITTCLSYVFFGAIGVFSLASLCAMAHAKEFNPVLIYGSTTAGFSLASALGLACGTLPIFSAQNGEQVLHAIMTCYFAFLLAYSLVMSWRKIRSYDKDAPFSADFASMLQPGWDNAPVNENASDSEAQPDQKTQGVAARCAKVADEYKLSPRETEIFGYLGRGHGIVFIAETLVISESTVRTHVKNIYKKIGVSSREELLQLVDQER